MKKSSSSSSSKVVDTKSNNYNSSKLDSFLSSPSEKKIITANIEQEFVNSMKERSINRSELINRLLREHFQKGGYSKLPLKNTPQKDFKIIQARIKDRLWEMYRKRMGWELDRYPLTTDYLFGNRLTELSQELHLPKSKILRVLEDMV